jgi:hypothetical protein
MHCPGCGAVIASDRFTAEVGRASGVTFYLAGCRCGRALRRVTRPRSLTT